MVVVFGLLAGGLQVTYKVAVVRDEKEVQRSLAAGAGLGAAVGSATTL
eukprot:COSAG02_NODE_747_length_17723_cov_49.509816_9_plen_48_part_00